MTLSLRAARLLAALIIIAALGIGVGLQRADAASDLSATHSSPRTVCDASPESPNRP